MLFRLLMTELAENRKVRWLLLFLLVLLLWIIPHSVIISNPFRKDTLALTIQKQDDHITDLDTEKEIIREEEFTISRLTFPRGSSFSHNELPWISYSTNFFATIRTIMIVKETMQYRFTIGSDDGYRLSIDGTEISSFVSDRPYAKNNVRIELSPGNHLLELEYYQGSEQLGLEMTYEEMEGTPIPIGKKSKNTRFRLPSESEPQAQ